MTEELEGVVERITYYNEESGYTVLRLRPSKRVRPGEAGRDGLVTVVGSMQELNPDEMVRFTGTWDTHSKYGKQFRAERAQQIIPSTLEGLRRFLGSLRGIGPTTANRLVDHFGLKIVEVLDNAPERVMEVNGIGEFRAGKIRQAWIEHRLVKDVMVFLQGHGLGASFAVKIYRQYGDQAIQQVRADPYRLARDIEGIGFKTADRIARSMGLPIDSPERIAAGVIYALETLTNDGHVYAPRELVIARVAELLQLPAGSDAYGFPDDELAGDRITGLIHDAIEQLAQDSEILIQHVPDEDGELMEALYLRAMGLSERNTARRLLAMSGMASSRLRGARSLSWIKFFQLLERLDRIHLTDQQKAAVEAALTHKISILTGGPGTGKTTTLRAVIRALETARASYALASPTGRAAKRLSEATGRPASTLHRLLGFVPGEGAFYREDEPLDVDILIIDEASMLDLVLFYTVLKALAPETHLMLVGDVDQLPSVGPGDVLRDLIRGGIAHVTRLDTIFRQADDSLIITNAHRINQGQMPILDNQAADFFMFGQDDPELVADLVVDVVQHRIPNRFGLHPLDDIQVLAPMYRGSAGIEVLNEKLQAALNPPGRAAEKKIGGRVFRVGDKVMQTRNNYEKDVYNGDIGRIHSLDFTAQTLQLVIDDRFVEYDWAEVDELVHAFAVSVHKSQGSEYPAVVLPLMPQHYMMLQRNLLYTAVTRARQLVVLVGMKKAVAMAVRNDKVARRYTALAWRLGGQGAL